MVHQRNKKLKKWKVHRVNKKHKGCYIWYRNFLWGKKIKISSCPYFNCGGPVEDKNGSSHYYEIEKKNNKSKKNNSLIVKHK